MRSHNDSIDTTHAPPPLSFYNTFNPKFCKAKYTGPKYFVFFSFGHHSSVKLLPVVFLLLTYTVSRVRACLSIYLERFRESQKED